MYVDDLMTKVLKRLGIELPEYNVEVDPTKQEQANFEWTIPPEDVKEMDKIYSARMKERPKKRGKNGYYPICNSKLMKKDFKAKSEKNECTKEEESK